MIGSRNQPIAGQQKIKFSGKVEYNSVTLTAGMVAGTRFPFYQTWTTTEAISAGFAQMQVVIPQLALTKGLPKVKAGDTTMQDLSANVTNDGTNRDVYVVLRTADTAL